MNIITRDESMKLVRENETIQQIVSAEPEFARLLELAAHPSPRYNRWVSYEALKRMGRTLVGWSARHEQLRTGEHHRAMCWALDLLLPDDTINPPPSEYYDRMWQDLLERARSPRSEGWMSLAEIAATLTLPSGEREERGA